MEPLVEDKDYSLIDGVLTINEGVEFIPDCAFKVRKDIKEVILPSTLIAIGRAAFHMCSITGTVIIPDSVRYICDYAFFSNSIEKLILGRNVTYIGENTCSCNQISQVVNNSTNLKYFGHAAFALNEELSNFNFDPSSILFISNVFSSTKIEVENIKCGENIKKNTCNFETKDKYTYENGLLRIHDGVQSIGSFRELKDCISVEMPDSVLFIDYYAFDELTKLKSIRFSNNLLCISSFAFNGCNLEEKLILPDSVCNVFDDAFKMNLSIKEISLSPHAYIIDHNNLYERHFKKRNKYTDYKYFNNNAVYDIKSLQEEEKRLLEALNLMPETIKENKKIFTTFNKRQSDFIKESLIKFIVESDYDEIYSLTYVKNQLELKSIDVSDMHESINYLFENKQMKTIYLLISYGYDYLNNSMISRAIINDMYEMIDILLILGSNINEIGTIDMTPLSIACQKGDYYLVKKLIEKGAAINMVDKNNKTAVDYAKENNNHDIVSLIESYRNEKSEIESDIDIITKKLVQ